MKPASISQPYGFVKLSHLGQIASRAEEFNGNDENNRLLATTAYEYLGVAQNTLRK
ncbi:MAG: hypothetical protein ABL921_29405 [Pirellula sp.]